MRRRCRMPTVNEMVGQRLPVGNLADALKLLKAEKKTGVLRVSEEKQYARFYLRAGVIYYADSSSSGAPLGARVIKRGRITRKTVDAAEAEINESDEPKLLGEVLKERTAISEDVLAAFLRDQIVDAMLNAFLKEEPVVDVVPDWSTDPSGARVTMDSDKVADKGRQWAGGGKQMGGAMGGVDKGRQWAGEWKQMMETMGSLDKVPHLNVPSAETGVRLSRSRWEVVSYIDGRRDINTVVAESGMDRFRTVRSIHSLITGGLTKLQDPTLELLGQKHAVAVVGPIDIYNLTLLTSASTGEVTSHTRLENVKDKEVEVKISAAVREEDGEDGVLMYSTEARTPRTVVKRMALETSGYIVLVNRNSSDSVIASGPDIELMRSIGDRPYVVVSYASMEDEKVEEAQVRELLALGDRVPIREISLRDSAQVGSAVDTLLKMIPS